MDGTGPHEMQFLLPKHLLLMQCSGSSHGGEWFGAESRGRLPAQHCGAMIFNPADQHMVLRRQGQTRGRLLMLLIDPAETFRLGNAEFDPSNVVFCQQPNLLDEELRKILLTLVHELEAGGLAGRSYCQILILMLLTRLIRCASNLSQPVYTKGGLAGWRLKRATQLLEANLDKTPSLDELARHVGLNPTYFCSAFKQSTGISPRHYLFHCRVSRAKELIAASDTSLTRRGHPLADASRHCQPDGRLQPAPLAQAALCTIVSDQM